MGLLQTKLKLTWINAKKYKGDRYVDLQTISKMKDSRKLLTWHGNVDGIHYIHFYITIDNCLNQEWLYETTDIKEFYAIKYEYYNTISRD